MMKLFIPILPLQFKEKFLREPVPTSCLYIIPAGLFWQKCFFYFCLLRHLKEL